MQRRRSESEPRLPKSLRKQERHERAGDRDPDADAHEDRAAGKPASGRGNMGENVRRREHHQRAPRRAGDETPDEKPGEAGRIGASEEGRCREQHHCPQHGDEGHARRKRAPRERAKKVSSQICSAEIGGGRRLEPVGADDDRQERRIGEPRKTDADEARAEGRNNRTPYDGGRLGMFSLGDWNADHPYGSHSRRRPRKSSVSAAISSTFSSSAKWPALRIGASLGPASR